VELAVTHRCTAWTADSLVAIEGKTSRRSKMAGKQAQHLVRAFAVGVRLLRGQESCAEKSSELAAIPVLREALLLKGVIVTIDAMGNDAPIAQAMRDKEARYVLAVQDNQPKWPSRSRRSSRSGRP
jgi:hypothetical protein